MAYKFEAYETRHFRPVHWDMFRSSGTLCGVPRRCPKLFACGHGNRRTCFVQSVNSGDNEPKEAATERTPGCVRECVAHLLVNMLICLGVVLDHNQCNDVLNMARWKSFRNSACWLKPLPYVWPYFKVAGSTDSKTCKFVFLFLDSYTHNYWFDTTRKSVMC